MGDVKGRRKSIKRRGVVTQPGWGYELRATSNEPTPEPRRVVLRPLVFASVVVGSTAIGALILALGTNPVLSGSAPNRGPEGSSGPTHSVIDVPQGTDAVDYGPVASTGQGNYLAAAQWFQRAATPSDTFPSSDQIDGLNSSSTRLVGGTPKKLKVWVGKTDDDRVCLIMTVPSTQDALESVNSCADAQQFDAMGLGLHAGGCVAVIVLGGHAECGRQAVAAAVGHCGAEALRVEL